MIDLILRKTEYKFSYFLDIIRYYILPYRNNKFKNGKLIYKTLILYIDKYLWYKDISNKTILEIGSWNTIIQWILFKVYNNIEKYIYSEPFMYFPKEKNIKIAKKELEKNSINTLDCFIDEKTLNSKYFNFNTDLVVDLKNIPNESIDIIITNAVFEHIRAEDLDNISTEMFRVLKKWWAMIHQIDLRDHWYYFFKNYAFLKYSFKEWFDLTKIANYSVFWSNRLRCIDFENSFSKNFTIIESIRQKYSKEKLILNNVHTELKNKYSKEELETEWLLIICKK